MLRLFVKNLHQGVDESENGAGIFPPGVDQGPAYKREVCPIREGHTVQQKKALSGGGRIYSFYAHEPIGCRLIDRTEGIVPNISKKTGKSNLPS
jgi:hypothetical protein